MSKPIEDYALLGDGETAALVSRDGAIDWLCWPRFDDDACFAALLGTEKNGHWTVAPVAAVRHHSRRYQEDSLIVETDFEVDGGAIRVIDFMPMRTTFSSVVRIVVGLRGNVKVRSTLCLRFDYGALPPWSALQDDCMVAKVGPDLVILRAPVPLDVSALATVAEFDVAQGSRLAFVMSYGPSHQPAPGAIDAEAALSSTQRFWRDWIDRFDDAKTDWPREVRRSLLTLKALIHQTSGGLIAAPTTSLPEAPGGTMNWDYRYCWLRDASFTLGALLNAGFHEEALAWRDWLLRAVAGSPERVRIMYRVDGARHLAEWSVDSLPGYRYAQPVRVGNAASTQHQIDVFGELLDCLDLARRGGVPVSAQEAAVMLKIVEHLETMWDSEGSGVWESRAAPRQYTYSKVMAWVAFDRFLRHDGTNAGAEPVARHVIERITALRTVVHEQVCREGWNEGLGSFTQYYGGQEIDASLLLLPLVGFLPADDPRMAATIATIQRELADGGLIRRTRARREGPSEGAFLACSCWMADCLHLQGRTDEARAQLDRVLAVGNDLGLFSEEYDVPGKRLSGNFPQALTHLAIVNTALRLCGPTLARDGGASPNQTSERAKHLPA
ncbi:glycoside hydrolase family 15 protein [Robbsia sp. Bb-Pol-6]|uniref:Glycoside hydrolase family 15 protein n=1 Tax=Robbsia betulipollinis TaxID=2981849 RepID=A0ABT3ZJI0_9BURK|nr:glycoside hydrolase family 15 protein [Robbsia betulipollinis]MCY0386676.1 glycoside hydrolase family 15 protein [Robbsia betulipollinis]